MEKKTSSSESFTDCGRRKKKREIRKTEKKKNVGEELAAAKE